MITNPTSKPAIELRGIKHVEWASEETNCYTATLYVDGEKWADVGNEGHGGPDHFYPVKGRNYDDLKALEARIAATYPAHDMSQYEMEPLPASLEMVCGNLIADHLITKDLKRALASRMLYTKPDKPGIFETKLKQKGRAWTVDQIAASFAKQGFSVGAILNNLPFDEALTLYKAGA